MGLSRTRKYERAGTAAEVPRAVLEGILSDACDKAPTLEEKAALEKIPNCYKNWFEEAVFDGFYMLMRHVVRESPSKPGIVNIRFLEVLAGELLPPGSGFEGWQGHKQTIRLTYLNRQNQIGSSRGHIFKSENFEDAVKKALEAYRGVVFGNLQVQYDNRLSFRYLSVNNVIAGIRQKLF